MTPIEKALERMKAEFKMLTGLSFDDALNGPIHLKRLPTQEECICSKCGCTFNRVYDVLLVCQDCIRVAIRDVSAYKALSSIENLGGEDLANFAKDILDADRFCRG